MAINETLKSTQELLKRIQTEGITSGGVQQPISADALNMALKSAKLPELPTDNIDYKGMVNIGNATLGALIAEPPQGDQTADLFKKYIEGAEPPKDPTIAYSEAREQAEIAGKEEDVLAKQQALKTAQNELNLINAQLKGLATETQQRQLEIGKEPISAGAIQGRNIEEERNLAIRALPLQAQAFVAQAKIQAAQGDVETSQATLRLAEDRINQVFELQQNYQDRLYKFGKEKRDAVYEFATKQQQILLDKQDKEDERAYQEKRDAINNAQSVANSLLQTQPDLAAKISAIDWDKPNAQAEFVRLQGQIKPKTEKIPIPKVEKPSKNEKIKTAIDQQLKDINAFGADRKVSWETYLQMNQAWINSGGTQAGFNLNYPIGQYLDAGNQKEYQARIKGGISPASTSAEDFYNSL